MLVVAPAAGVPRRWTLPRALVVALTAFSACGASRPLVTWPLTASAAERVTVSAWRAYTHGYVQSDGRVVDHQGGGITTSEGQAYALVRAWWAGDSATFDRLLRWTVDNLQQGDPAALPAWKWGARDDGSWGVLDANPASDADLWIVWALLGAAADWDRPDLAERAVALSARVWDEETAVVGGRRVLLPGPWGRGGLGAPPDAPWAGKPVTVNPSYLMPFVFRTLADADPTRPWSELVDSSYALLSEAADERPLASDWLWLDLDQGVLHPPPSPEDADKLAYGFDAIRVPWVLTADLVWHDEPRARALLAPYLALLDRFLADGRLPGVIAPDGTAAVPWESRSLYAALLPLAVHERPAAVAPLRARIAALEADGRVRRAQGRDYYAENWIWFGEALSLGVAGPPARTETP